ncbi:putative tRNA-splicing endonuclease subunit sen54 [Spathaspora sp. JA1]|nr:putative tRNA-splicing endonuclease subunit sen54 [Spathaspora sp. JA1]
MSGIDTIEPEDELPDYTQLSIPKRGDKEFQPDGTNTQQSALQASLEAMYSALDSLRIHHVKQKLIGIWREDNCCYVAHPRGSYFKDMGVAGGKKGGVVLNAIECLYLAERGSMVVYLGGKEADEEDIENTGLALNLSYLYALAKVDLAEYQVYSYLKRLGYIIQTYTSVKHVPSNNQPKERTKIKTSYLIGLAREWGILAYPPFHTMHFKTKHYFNYTDIFKSLSLDAEPIPATAGGKFNITFRVWKPTPSFSKKSPPPPDFHIVVLDTSTDTKFPSLADIQALHEEISSKIEPRQKVKAAPKKKSSMPPSKREIRAQRQAQRQSKLDHSIQVRNGYLSARDSHLKNGSVNVVVAIVNQGIINFVNLSKGNFRLKNCHDLEQTFPNKAHSIIYNEF